MKLADYYPQSTSGGKFDTLARELHAVVEAYLGPVDELIEKHVKTIADRIVEERATKLIAERQRETIETLTKLLAVLTVK